MKKVRGEDSLQRACCQLLDVYEAQGKLKYFAVPNGGKRSRIEASIMKGLGTKAGISDLVILITNGPSLFVELKSDTGSLTAAQLAWNYWINQSGGNRRSTICRDLDYFHTIVKYGMETASGKAR